MGVDPRQLAQFQQMAQPQVGGQMQPPPAPPSPDEAITQLLLATVGRKDLGVDVQSKAILTLAQAIAQLNQQQLQQIPAQAQFELEAKKFQMEHQLKQAEFDHRKQIEVQAHQHKLGLDEQKMQAEIALKQQQAQMQAAQAEKQAQLKEATTVHDQKMKQETNDANIASSKAKASDNAAKKPTR